MPPSLLHARRGRAAARTVAGLLVLVAAALPARQVLAQSVRAPALFADGERVCFIGDSITHGDDGQSDYHEFIYLYYLTRFPQRRIVVFDRGISGDTSWGAVARFDQDIAPCKPTVCTVMLGMNDVDRGLYGSSPECSPAIQARRDARLERYSESMQKLCTQIATADSRLVLFTPSPFDQVSLSRGPEHLQPARPRVNDGLIRCADLCRELARRHDASLVDMNTGVLNVLARQHERDPTYSFYDTHRVHPDMRGHFVMAYLFLKAQHAPAVVSAVALDAAGGRVTEAANCEVTDLACSGSSARFTLNAHALPFPTDELGPLGLRLVPFMQELNLERLCVKGFEPGAYALAIDGDSVGHYDAAALADGINLAQNGRTPQYRQALEVAAVNLRRGDLSNRLRGMALIELKTLNRFTGDKTDMAQVRAFFDKRLAGMEGKTWHPFYVRQFDGYIKSKPRAGEIVAEMRSLEEQLYRLNQPKPHRYALTRAGDALPLPDQAQIAEPDGLSFHLPFDGNADAAQAGPASAPLDPGDLAFETGPVGEAVVIRSGDGLRYKEPAAFPLRASSIAFWIKPHWDPAETDELPAVFRKDDPARLDGHLINHQEIRFAAGRGTDGGANLVYSSSPGPTADGGYPQCGASHAAWPVSGWDSNEWLHVCVTVDAFGRTWGTRLYVQGEIVDVGQWQTPPQSHAETFTLGGGERPMSIDDFRAYGRVLSEYEVYELYRLGAERAALLNPRRRCVSAATEEIR